MAIRRTTVMAVAALLGAAGTVVLTATSAGADNLTCLAPVDTVQISSNEAIGYDKAGDIADATVQDGDTTYYQNVARQTCYFNPNVPYTAYEDAISGFTYVNAALSANQAGNASAATADGQTAATYLNAAIAILYKGP
ncbi:MAG TPA: hypothetical protein VH333_24015 [Pseudonocardiaceae bacterium]|jgi:hypothetical protein|nr:hypothetical protein [Pseudonocardiaceae bacterium]